MNTNETMKQWQEEQALKRFRLIAPLLEEGLDTAKIKLDGHIDVTRT